MLQRWRRPVVLEEHPKRVMRKIIESEKAWYLTARNITNINITIDNEETVFASRRLSEIDLRCKGTMISRNCQTLRVLSLTAWSDGG